MANTGSAALNVTNVSIDNARFRVKPPGGFILRPGEEKGLIVQFIPTGVRPQKGNLMITSNDSDNPTVSVQLIAKGVLRGPL